MALITLGGANENTHRDDGAEMQKDRGLNDSNGKLGCLAIPHARMTLGMAALGLGRTGTRNSSPGGAFKIHNLGRAVGLFPLARPAPEAEDSPGMIVRRMGQKRRQWNWLAAGHAADATVRLLNSFHVHIKRLLKDMCGRAMGAG